MDQSERISDVKSRMDVGYPGVIINFFFKACDIVAAFHTEVFTDDIIGCLGFSLI